MTDIEFPLAAAREVEPEAFSRVHRDRHGHWLGGAKTRLLAARLLTVVPTVTVAAALAVTGCSSGNNSSQHHKSSSASPKTRPQPKCETSGCAEVKTTLSLPQTTVLYGASCTGVHGSWFFNAIEGGGSNQLRPNYHIQWAFTKGATSARPSGLITVPRTKAATVTLTLSAGKLKLHGVKKSGAPVTAKGTLVVKLSGSRSSHTLTFTETGLSAAEHSLGLVSPFDAGGHPLVVHIKHVKSLPGC